MIWAELIKSLVLGIVRGVLGIKGTDDARQLGETIGEDILERGLHPAEPSQPLSYKEVARQQAQIRNASPFPPPVTSPTARPPPLPPVPAPLVPLQGTVPLVPLPFPPPPPPRARSSAAPPPVMPSPIRPPKRKR